MNRFPRTARVTSVRAERVLPGAATRRWFAAAWVLALTTLLAGYGGQALAQDSEPPLLKVEEAFRLSVSAAGPDMIEARWDIADGYFLYRDKFRFTTDVPGVQLDPASLPPGKVKEDEFFGQVETYRHQVSALIPVRFDTAGEPKPSELRLTATYQGCADVGVCYPPHTQTIAFAASTEPAPPTLSDTPKGAGLLAALGNKLGFGAKQDEFLPPEQAFMPRIDAIDGNTLRARWDIAEGYYLYRDKFGFALKDGADLTLGAPQSPAGEFKEDDSFGRMEVYHNRVDILLPLARQSTAATELTIEAKYQGCAEAGFCYPPLSQLFTVAVPAGTAGGSAAGAGGAMSTGQLAASTAAPSAAPQFVSEQDQLVASLSGDNRWLTIAAFFGLGLLLAFTPCVFPMVPILSSIIVGQGTQATTRKAFTLSLAYVLAMAVTYTIAGVIAGFTGANLQAAFQDPWIVGAFSLVFVALAFSMFGFYELQIPSSWQSKLAAISNQQAGGTVAGAAVMGFLSALIVGPCVAAPLAAALIYISQTKDALLGGVALFSLSMGMGAPLLLIGTSAGKLLPRVGDWMNTIKAVFGVMLLALAIWMLERVVPAQVSMALWSALAIVTAVYLGALRRLGPDASGWQKLWQGSGMVSMFYGALLMVGVASGGKDPLRPLENFALGAATSAGEARVGKAELEFQKVKGIAGLEQQLAAARQAGKPVMLDFYADWCVSCKEMERYTFSDSRVHEALRDVVLLQTDVTDNDAADQALLKQFGIFGPPAILFFDPNGQEERQFRIIGFMKADQFLAQANLALQ